MCYRKVRPTVLSVAGGEKLGLCKPLKARGITLVLEAIGIAGIAGSAGSALVCQIYVYGYALDLVALWLVAHWGQQMVLEKCA